MAVRDQLRTLKQAAWLGWQMESNWTRPWLFAIYSVIKPIAATLILVFMYIVVQSIGGQPNPALFSYMFIGNAFYMYVAQVLLGITWVIIEDREHYQTLKQVYIAPISFYMYLIGRSVSKIVLTTIATFVTLTFGVLVLNVPIDLAQINWPLFALAMIIGLFCICMIGIALAGISFLTAKHSAGINEGIAGLFYLFCGVVFPLTVLPDWGRAIGLCIPITYWLEIVRRAVQPSTVSADISGLGGYSNPTILFFLTISTIAFLFISLAIFKYADHVARKKGKIDMTTTY